MHEIMQLQKQPHWALQTFRKTLVQNFKILGCILSLGEFPASEIYMPTFRNTLSVPSS